MPNHNRSEYNLFIKTKTNTPSPWGGDRFCAILTNWLNTLS